MSPGRLGLPLALLLAAAACTPAPTPRGSNIERRAQPPLMAATATVATTTTGTCAFSKLERRETLIDSAPGVRVFVMQMLTPLPRRGAAVFTHGAGSPSSALWDLKTGDYSLMRNLACAGFDSYTVDVRGFGGSSKPPRDTMVRAQDVMPDVLAVVRLAKKESRVERVNLIGWSWGSELAALFTTQHPELIDRLALIAPLYDRKWPTRHSEHKKWRRQDRAEFYKYFDPLFEDRAVLDEHVAALFRFADEKGELWLPSGPYRDLYGDDVPLWAATKISVPVLIVRGERDPASTAQAVERLSAALLNTSARVVTIADEGHFPFRTRKHHALIGPLLEFLQGR